MIGILLIYFIGKYFYQLAETYNQKKWLFAILGVLCYYAGTFIGGVVIGLFGILLNIEIDWNNKVLTTITGLIFGIASCYLFYYLLKRNWESKHEMKDSIDDIGNNIDEI